MAIIAQCAKCNLFLNLKKHPDECPHCGASFRQQNDKTDVDDDLRNNCVPPVKNDTTNH